MDRTTLETGRRAPCAPRRVFAVLAFGVAALGCAGGAAAAPGCEGTYDAALLQPLPTPTVVALDVSDNSPANQRMAERFAAGLREAGVTIGTPPNVVLLFSVAYRNRFGEMGDDFASPGTSDYSDLQGGLRRIAPALPADRLSSQGPAPQSLLNLRIEARSEPAKQVLWFAVVQCRVTGTDDGQRAQNIGRALGGAIGQRVERRPL